MVFACGLRRFAGVVEDLETDQHLPAQPLQEEGVARVRTLVPDEKNGAGDGDRTHDIQLGKLTFYR